jgi:hypothetical protein
MAGFAIIKTMAKTDRGPPSEETSQVGLVTTRENYGYDPKQIIIPMPSECKFDFL